MEEGPGNSRSKDSETSSHLKCVREEKNPDGGGKKKKRRLRFLTSRKIDHPSSSLPLPRMSTKQSIPPGAKEGERKEGRKEGYDQAANQKDTRRITFFHHPPTGIDPVCHVALVFGAQTFAKTCPACLRRPIIVDSKDIIRKRDETRRERARAGREGRETKTGNTLDPWGFSWIEGEGYRGGRITNALGLLTKWKLSVIFFFALRPSILFHTKLATLRIGGGFLAWRRDLGLDTCLMWVPWVYDRWLFENVCVEREILWWLNRLWLINTGTSNVEWLNILLY